jgi:hypothetical protein
MLAVAEKEELLAAVGRRVYGEAVGLAAVDKDHGKLVHRSHIPHQAGS